MHGEALLVASAAFEGILKAAYLKPGVRRWTVFALAVVESRKTGVKRDLQTFETRGEAGERLGNTGNRAFSRGGFGENLAAAVLTCVHLEQ